MTGKKQWMTGVYEVLFTFPRAPASSWWVSGKISIIIYRRITSTRTIIYEYEYFCCCSNATAAPSFFHTTAAAVRFAAGSRGRSVKKISCVASTTTRHVCLSIFRRTRGGSFMFCHTYIMLLLVVITSNNTQQQQQLVIRHLI